MSTQRDQQRTRIASSRGFIAALDQSGGSTPKTLKLYGVDEDAYNGESEMFAAMHAMRSRIMQSRAFAGDRVIGAILFEDTMGRSIGETSAAHFLWSQKQVVPFLKVDQGLTDEANGVQLMRPISGLDGLLERALAEGIFGTKMRSVVKIADQSGVDAIVDQQFEVGRQILGRGLVPIIEPEVDIHSRTKAEAEGMLRAAIIGHLDRLDVGQEIMLKLTLPEIDGFHQSLVDHPRVLRVVALSGGYSRDEANARLRRNPFVIASFSRALAEGLTFQQSDQEFDAMLDASIQSIYDASVA